MRVNNQVLVYVAATGSLVSFGSRVFAFVPGMPSSSSRIVRSSVTLTSRFSLRIYPTHVGRRSVMSMSTMVGEDSNTTGSSSSGGRASAAVLQDQERRTGSTGGPSEKLDLKPPKGTRDMFPGDMRQRNWLFGHWRSIARSFGFEEYDAPVLENEALYVRKSGEEVTQQLYCFEDKGGRRVSLRPEMTPSLARMVMAKRKSLTMPVKWFSLPQCWRYERMTRGRRREHYQWNMDIWGVAGVEAEAELLGAVVAFFKQVGLSPEDVGIKVNSRGVLTEVLRGLGVPEDKHTATCVVVDKLDKVPLEAISGELEALGLDGGSIRRLLQVMEVRDMADIEGLLGEESSAVTELRRLFDLASSYGLTDWLVLDCSVVRGLAYYTGTVFEAFDRRGNLRAICGGGRYDSLLESFGGEPLPAVGFGFGDAVIVELLADKGLLPEDPGPDVDAVVFAWNPELQGPATKVAGLLRQEGLSVDLVLEIRKTKMNFKHASRIGASHVVMIAPSEWQQGKVSVKNLQTSSQSEVALADVANHILDANSVEETNQ